MNPAHAPLPHTVAPPRSLRPSFSTLLLMRSVAAVPPIARDARFHDVPLPATQREVKQHPANGKLVNHTS